MAISSSCRPLLVLSLCVCAAPAMAAAPTPDDGTVAGEVGARAHAWVERMVPLGFSGAVLLVQDGEVLLARAYGDADRTRGVPARRDTLWPIGSISKHFTAAAVLHLVQRGELSVEDTLGERLDDVPEPYAAISVHQLLCHQSGWPESSISGRSPRTAADHLAHAFATELDFAPGTEAGYSNLGYGVLAALVERVSGQPFEGYLREHVLLPAGMTDTAIAALDWDDARVARGMIDGQDRGRLDGWDERPWGLLGAGGIQTTLDDMAAWSAALRNGTVLDADSLALMSSRHTPFGPDGAMGYGCGVFRTPRGTTMLGHNGSDDVFSADWKLYLEDGLTVFVTANHADVYADVVSEAVTAIALGSELPLPPAVVALSAADLARYAGAWALDDGGRVHTEVRGQGLLVSGDGARPAGLVHPVPGWQVERREGLLLLCRVAFEEALDGDWERLHLVLDRHAPREVFVEHHAGMLAQWADELGACAGVSTLPGRNRFGEIAVVVALEFERGRRMIEYSFGEDEVGSIRLLPAMPARLVQPVSREAFVAYDPGSGASWSLGFELEDGVPRALRLSDPSGEVVRALRVAD